MSAEGMPAADHTSLRKLRARFLEGLGGRLAAIEEQWRTFEHARDAGALDASFRMVHRLSGAGGTFGFPEVSRAAVKLEEMLWRRTEAGAPAAGIDSINAALADLIDVCRGATRDGVPDSGEFALPRAARGSAARTLLLVEDDELLASQLTTQLEARGHEVHVAAAPAELRELVERIRPVAVLMDIVFDEGHLAGVEAVAKMQADCPNPPPVVFFSSRLDLEARVAAVRAGGAAYLTKPLALPALAEKLDELTGEHPRRPYQILVVDDDAELAQLFARTLENAGMATGICTDPLRIMEALAGTEPDLVLLDYHMPGCTGAELAQALRQTAGYEALPIVFLSTEADRTVQLKAMASGGDEFLGKPIDPEHLVLAVKSRAERGRALQGLLDRDGLTRLLNHVSLKRNLEVELARARRQRQPLCFAMIDIDRFKTINDQHGHAMGDRILRTLSTLLADRLRKTDLIGRYGGDELGVILPATSGPIALEILDEIRVQFTEVARLPPGGAQPTFSCGIAFFPEHAEAKALIEAADDALYAAKAAGRNLIRLSVSAAKQS